MMGWLKKGDVIVVAVALLISSCVTAGDGAMFRSRMAGTTRVTIGSGFDRSDGSGDRVDAVVLTDADGIRSFLASFTFHSEHDFTVKHPLGRFVRFDLPGGESVTIRYEGSIMRYGRREYCFDEATEEMLSRISQGK